MTTRIMNHANENEKVLPVHAACKIMPHLN